MMKCNLLVRCYFPINKFKFNKSPQLYGNLPTNIDHIYNKRPKNWY